VTDSVEEPWGHEVDLHFDISAFGNEAGDAYAGEIKVEGGVQGQVRGERGEAADELDLGRGWSSRHMNEHHTLLGEWQQELEDLEVLDEYGHPRRNRTTKPISKNSLTHHLQLKRAQTRHEAGVLDNQLDTSSKATAKKTQLPGPKPAQ